MQQKTGAEDQARSRAEQIRKANEKLEKLLLEGLNSGEPIEITPEYWTHEGQLIDGPEAMESIRLKMEARLKARTKNSSEK